MRSEAASVRGGQARSSRARGGAGLGMLGEGGGVVGHELWPEYPRVTRLRHDVVVRDVASTRLVGEPVIRERDAVLVIAIDEDGELVIRTYI